MTAVREDPQTCKREEWREIRSALQRDEHRIVLTLPLRDSGNEGDGEMELLSELVERLAREFNQEVEKRQSAAFQRIIESYVEAYGDQVPLSDRARRRADMIGHARREVLQGAGWLTAREIAELAGITGTNPGSQVSKWKRGNRIFSITHHGRDYYPDYALDDDFRPVPGLKPILECFSDKSDWGVAYWFAGANSYLGGRRPLDLLKSDPSRVLVAAEHELTAVAQF